MNQIRKLFSDKIIVAKIQNKLPKLFHLAELENSRAGKVGMEVGSVREKIIVVATFPIMKPNRVPVHKPHSLSLFLRFLGMVI